MSKAENLTPVIDLYAWIAAAPDGSKGILGVPLDNGETVMMVGTECMGLMGCRNHLEQMVKKFGQEIAFVQFTATKVIDIVHCNAVN
jgi:hypothetical protein